MDTFFHGGVIGGLDFSSLLKQVMLSLCPKIFFFPLHRRTSNFFHVVFERPQIVPLNWAQSIYT